MKANDPRRTAPVTPSWSLTLPSWAQQRPLRSRAPTRRGLSLPRLGRRRAVEAGTAEGGSGAPHARS